MRERWRGQRGERPRLQLGRGLFRCQQLVTLSRGINRQTRSKHGLRTQTPAGCEAWARLDPETRAGAGVPTGPQCWESVSLGSGPGTLLPPSGRVTTCRKVIPFWGRSLPVLSSWFHKVCAKDSAHIPRPLGLPWTRCRPGTAGGGKCPGWGQGPGLGHVGVSGAISVPAQGRSHSGGPWGPAVLGEPQLECLGRPISQSPMSGWEIAVGGDAQSWRGS